MSRGRIAVFGSTLKRDASSRSFRFPERDLLQSGWLIGAGVIAKKAAMVSVALGRGRVVMIGFRPQHRAQTHGTFKLVFNALLNWDSLDAGRKLDDR